MKALTNAEQAIRVLKPHVSLNVSSLSESIEFYSKMFQASPVKKREHYAKFDLLVPSLNLTLNENSLVGKGQSNLAHLGIQLAGSDDVARMKELWQNAGLLPRDELQTTCCYALQDKTWISDPDGNEWEAFAVLEDDLPVESGKGSCSTSGCC